MIRAAARGRLIGGRVGALIGGGWAIYAVFLLPLTLQISVLVFGALAAGSIFWESRRLERRITALPAGDSASAARQRRIRVWFAVVVVGEIALLNVAISLLSRQDLHVYWVPAISAVVGLHFIPLAILFRMTGFWLCAAAMMLVAVVFALAIGWGSLSATLGSALEGVANAAILWGTSAFGLVTLRSALAVASVKGDRAAA